MTVAPGAGPPRIQLMIVGAQKCGTTSLFQYLGSHPGLESHPQREMAYFLSDAMYERGWPEALEKYYGGGTEDGSKLLAKHVMAMYSDEAVERLREHNPGVRVVVCLREPVARAYSAFLYARRRGWEPLESFEEAVAAEEERLRADGWETWRQCAYLQNSRYLPRVRTLLDTFGRERVSVFLTEDLARSSEDVCREVLRSVGLEPAPEMDVGGRHNPARTVRSTTVARGIARLLRRGSWFKRWIRPLIPEALAYRLRHAVYAVNETSGEPPEIDPGTARRLAREFREHNRQLGELIGRDLSAWNEPAERSG